VGIWQITPAGHTLYINPSMCRMLGVSGERNMVDRTFHEFFAPESLDLIATELAKRQQGIASSYEADLVPRGSGARRRVIIAGSPVLGPDGQVESVIGTFTDISERIAAESALRESESRLRAIIDNTPNIAIQGYDRAGCVQFWNRAAENLFGWPEAEAVGCTLDQLMLDQKGAAEFLSMLGDIERTGQPAGPGEWVFRRRDGRSGWCYSTIFAIADAVALHGGEPVFIRMDVDITERKRAEQALERGSEIHRLLLSELDHRVRNNLASLIGLIDISARDSRNVPEFAASVRDRVQAMSTVHALLSRDRWRSVDLKELLSTLAPASRPTAVTLDGPTVAVLPRQATALGMVLQELFANSLKHGSLGAAQGSVEVRWSVDSPGPDAPDVARENQPSQRLRLTWQERGGPPINEPIIPSIGSRLIHGLVRAQLAGEATLTYPREGVQHTLIMLLDDQDHTLPPPGHAHPLASAGLSKGPSSE
jgi:PAS domain S-box-containing protein